MSEQPDKKLEEMKKTDEAPLETVRPSVPAAEDKPTEDAEKGDKPEKSEEKEGTKTEVAKETKEEKPKAKAHWGGFLLDSFLVLALLGTLGGGGAGAKW